MAALHFTYIWISCWRLVREYSVTSKILIGFINSYSLFDLEPFSSQFSQYWRVNSFCYNIADPEFHLAPILLSLNYCVVFLFFSDRDDSVFEIVCAEIVSAVNSTISLLFCFVEHARYMYIRQSIPKRILCSLRRRCFCCQLLLPTPKNVDNRLTYILLFSLMVCFVTFISSFVCIYI